MNDIDGKWMIGVSEAMPTFFFINSNNKMSTVEYYRLTLLQLLKYNLSIESCIKLEEEIRELKGLIGQHQRKHRRCDRDINKEEQVPLSLYSVLFVRRSMARKWLLNCMSS